MLIFVTVYAQQFPVAAVDRIVVVIVVPVVHRQQLDIRAREFACASSADPRIDPERLFAVGHIPLFPVAPCFGDNTIQLAAVRWNGFGCH